MVDYDIYEEFRDPITYDLECDDFEDDKPVIEQWAKQTGAPLLDLACGTGRMALHMAQQGYQVTGVDLIPEMIAHARHKACEQNITSIDWVVSDARNFSLNQQFPFVFMLMNAFQFLHTRQDYEAMFKCVREHLTPDGYFLFETRNPSPRNLLQTRQAEVTSHTLTDGGTLIVTEKQYYDALTQLQHYTRHLNYQYIKHAPTEKTLRVALRYIFPQEMETLLHYNGFKIVEAYGNWQQDPLEADSIDMIYVCQANDV